MKRKKKKETGEIVGQGVFRMESRRRFGKARNQRLKGYNFRL